MKEAGRLVKNMKSTEHNKIDLLESSIRSGCQPDCPNLIYEYFRLGERLSCRRSKELRYKGRERAFKMLLETICDPLVSRHWRQTCLDNIYVPLLSLQREAESESQKQQVTKMYQELRVLSAYFLN